VTNRPVLIETQKHKIFRSSEYNYVFKKEDGYFARWGKTKDDDPFYSPYGPEILDLEISTSVHNPEDYPADRLVYDAGCKGNCLFCYKSNGRYPTYNMTLEEFKLLFSKLGKQLTQIAFGIMNLDTNPDFFAMAEYSRENGVIPNFTMHGLDDIDEGTAGRIKEIFGAVAVSCYNREKTYDTIKKLTDEGMSQVNIHYMLAKETYEDISRVISDIQGDPRLKKLNAIVFLSLKRKGRAVENDFHGVDSEEYRSLVGSLLEKKINFGFDSCGANKFIASIKGTEYEHLEQYAEPCESSCFSAYINARGEYFPCSFCEGEGRWKQGISVLNQTSLLDIWNAPMCFEFRELLKRTGRSCPVFNV